MPLTANSWAPTIDARNARRVQHFGVSRGVEPSRLGVALHADGPNARVPAGRMFDLWVELAAALDRSVPIHVAQASSIEDLQLLGFTVTTAPTVRDSLASFMRFCPLLSEAFGWSLESKSRVLEVRWHCRVPRHPGVCMALESSMAQFVNGMRQVAGVDIDPLRVQIAHTAPQTIGAHAALFRCPVDFDAARDRVLFPRHVLELEPIQANRALWTYLCARAEESLATLAPQPLSARVRGTIADDLLAGRTPRLRDLAERLATSERSLRRQLANDGLTFRRLVDEERRDRARALLSKPDASITRTALELGFTDSSALTHACHRWFSKPPSALKG